ncbi:MAG: thioredoxin [Clostridia bacterium]|jgi:thioredoxin 1|nr:thioredoxin [Clostridia bacterium]MBQ1376114.1 thioredoxin [Clostridia bacterium]MBQ1435954.1 thioredoxin [Clostridia bacterium]MBQ4249057.1 thioredoxin [Clostridia bacterium]
MASEKILNLKTDEFDREVINSNIPVLVDFWASWCGPCKMIAPEVDKLAESYDGRLKVCKVNVDEEPALAAEYMVMSIPTLIFFKGGEMQNKIIGVQKFRELSLAADSVIG